MKDLARVNNVIPVLPPVKISDEILEKVILHNDISGLKPAEKIAYVRYMSYNIGLNYNTNPLKVIKFQAGKESLYADKANTEELRKINNVTITGLEKELIDGETYVVTAYARLPDGREDRSTGAVNIANLKGDAKANALMKAETKAKRRVTLSICGLGMLDESELDTIPGVKKVEIKNEILSAVEVKEEEKEIIESEEPDYSTWQFMIEAANNLDNLKIVYEKLRKSESIKQTPEDYKKLIALVEEQRLKMIKNAGEIS